jgi:pyruvate-formate lyase-activating enzyme
MLYADPEGNILEHTGFEAVARSGKEFVPLRAEDFIELPNGSEIFFLPGRRPYGKDVKTGEIRCFEEGLAVSAFIAPANTQTYLAAFSKDQGAPVLPLYAYTCVAWLDDKFYVTALRIDPDIRQDVSQFHLPMVEAQVKAFRQKYPNNKLVDHLSSQCALNYHCRAAQNYFLNRWECPLPVSPACNAECLGCISLQPEDHGIQSSHFRLKFTPEVREIAEVAIDHLETAPNPIVSFGQGCEGEPLLVGDVIDGAIKEIRQHTSKGIININTNGSRPKTVEMLCKSGLQSIRVSMNSAQKAWYEAYYLPRNYKFEDIAESIRVIRRAGGWASINYFIFPGLSDSESEYQALRKFIRETGLTMIQWRNFNIDPEFYIRRAKINDPGPAMGVEELIKRIKEEFPYLAHGYFNPSEEVQSKYRAGLPKAIEL